MDALLLAYLGALVTPDPLNGTAVRPAGVREWIREFHRAPETRAEVASTLVRLGASSVPCLAELLLQPNADVSCWAMSR